MEGISKGGGEEMEERIKELEMKVEKLEMEAKETQKVMLKFIKIYTESLEKMNKIFN